MENVKSVVVNRNRSTERKNDQDNQSSSNPQDDSNIDSTSIMSETEKLNLGTPKKKTKPRSSTVSKISRFITSVSRSHSKSQHSQQFAHTDAKHRGRTNRANSISTAELLDVLQEPASSAMSGNGHGNGHNNHSTGASSVSSVESTSSGTSQARRSRNGSTRVSDTTKGSPGLSGSNERLLSVKNAEGKGNSSSSVISMGSSSKNSNSRSIKTSHNSAGADVQRSYSGTPSTFGKNHGPPRFAVLENGDHIHSLKNTKRQEKLSHLIKDLIGGKKARDEAISTVPELLKQIMPQAVPSEDGDKNSKKPPLLISNLINNVESGNELFYGSNDVNPATDVRPFFEKYGRCQEVVGRGAFGVVRIAHKVDAVSNKETLYAVKEFKRKPHEDETLYSKRLTSEFCISSGLHHVNIIDCLDLLRDVKGEYCEVMEFCDGGDLYSLIISYGKLEYLEADCFFKQLMTGVAFMHEMGVSHRDLKPENLLLTSQGTLKITDFGSAECFRMAWERKVHLSQGLCGSSPYIAPEEYVNKSFDPRPLDVWACGIIYMAMRTGRQLWDAANANDEFYQHYLRSRKKESGYEPIENLKRARCRNVIYSILDPVPERRLTAKQVLNSEWGREIKVCEAGLHGSNRTS